jgi:hypothetical protein
MLPVLPWVGIIVITAVVQFVRDAPVDGAVFGVVGLALLVDAAGMLPVVRRLPRPTTMTTLATAVIVGVLLTLTPRHGVVDGIVLAGLGLVVLPLAWTGVRAHPETAAKRPVDARALHRTAIAWAATAVATCLWELGSFLLGRVLPATEARQHPAISDLLDPALDHTWFRGLFVAGWLALGAGLILRGGRD